MTPLTQKHKHIRQRLKDDFVHYARKCLKIRTKQGSLAPFILNHAQMCLHQQLQEQRKKTGKIRAFILKGRQQGCSTYVGGRFYHRTTHARGIRSFILTHEMDASKNLFEMTARFHRHCPPSLRPVTGKDNARELIFPHLDSGYQVGTAGSRGAGRSFTVQLFHGSEVAFWPNAREHAAGVLQTIPDMPGTEVLFESTANGMDNFFHAGWQAAVAGQNEYKALFIPWFWQPEYSRRVPKDFSLEAEEARYMELHGLSLEQIVWRRNKITELKDPLLFQQEYPATPEEAFVVSDTESFIRADDVLRARRAAVTGYGPVVCGVDPARFGDDSTSIIFRQGRCAFGLRAWNKKDTMEVTGLCRQILEKSSPATDRLFIDAGGLGAGIVDRLREMGFGSRICAINFGSAALHSERYKNKRAEMWAGLRDWLGDELQVDIPDDEALHADLTAPQYSYDSTSRLVLESKESMRSRGVRSPDRADALALTFALPVRPTATRQEFADTSPMTQYARQSTGIAPVSKANNFSGEYA